jgi:hypothetical protein
MKTYPRACLLLTMLWQASVGLPANADIVAFSPTQPISPMSASVLSGSSPGCNIGIVFTPNVNISVTSLGYYVGGLIGGPFTSERPVGIYRVSDQALLDFVTVMPGDNLVGDFRYHNLVPLSLSAGTQYSVVGFMLAGEGRYAGITFPIGPAPEITQQNVTLNQDSMLSFPTSGLSVTFGPNFQFVESVPELSSFVFGGVVSCLVLCGLCLTRWRRRWTGIG